MVRHYDAVLRDVRLGQSEGNSGAIAKLRGNGRMLRIRKECRVVGETGLQAMGFELGFDIQSGVDGCRRSGEMGLEGEMV